MTRDKQMYNGDLTSGAQLVDRLLEAADGGREIRLGEYYASMILAMFEDSVFRSSVLAVHSAMPLILPMEPNKE